MEETQEHISIEDVVTALAGFGGSGEVEQVLNDLQQVMQRGQAQVAVELTLRDMVHDPQDIMERLDWETLAFTQGEIPNLEAQLAPLRAQKPYLFKSTDVLTGAHVAPLDMVQPPDLNTLTMDEYAAYRKASGSFSQR